MKKLKLSVAGSTPYISRLAEYIQKNGPGYLEVSECINTMELEPFLEKHQPDILLYEGQGQVQGFENMVRILLSDTKNAAHEDTQSVFRYQDGAAILRQIFLIYGKKAKKSLAAYSCCQPQDFNMEAVYAPGGHELQLAFALAYAACGEGEKTLFLNLAEFSGIYPLTRNPEGECLSDLIFGIRQRKEKFLFFLQSVLHHTPGYDYILPPNNPEDLYGFLQSDLDGLLELLREQTDYRRVIWNLGAFNQLAGELLSQCVRVFCVVKESSFGNYRKKEFEQFLEKERTAMIREKIQYVSPQAGHGMFVQGEGIFNQLQDGGFTSYVKGLVCRGEI